MLIWSQHPQRLHGKLTSCAQMAVNQSIPQPIYSIQWAIFAFRAGKDESASMDIPPCTTDQLQEHIYLRKRQSRTAGREKLRNVDAPPKLLGVRDNAAAVRSPAALCLAIRNLRIASLISYPYRAHSGSCSNGKYAYAYDYCIAIPTAVSWSRSKHVDGKL